MATVDLTRTAKLPAFARPNASNLQDELLKVQEVLNVREGNLPNGNLLDRGVTLKDLFDYGLISVTDATGKKRTGPGMSNDNPGTGGNLPPVSSIVDIPPPPQNVTAVGTLSSIFVSYDPPLFANFARAEIWRAEVDDFSKAARIDSTNLTFYVDVVGSGVSAYYWVRFISTGSTPGPFNAQAGTMGMTGEDPSYVLSILQGKVTESQLYQSLNSRIDLIDGPASLPNSLAAQMQAEQSMRSQNDQNIQSQVTNLQTSLSTNGTQTVTASAFSGLQSQVNTNAGNISSNSQSITNLQNSLSTNGTQTVTASAFSGLQSQVNTNQNNISANSTSLTSLQNSLSQNGTQTVTASAFSSMQTNVQNNTNNIQSNASSISGLQTSVNGNTSSIQTVQAVQAIAIAPAYDATKTYALNSVVEYGNSLYTCNTAITTPEAWNAAHWTAMQNNLYAQYTVKTDVNGYIAGFGLLNTGTTSEFIVRTDTFAVVPAGAAAGALTHAPFIVGSVNGQSTVGIDGALVVDGSISANSIHAGTIGADKLAVNTLSAISANVGTLTGGLVQSVDGTVKYDLTNKLFSVNDGTYNRVLMGYTPSGYGLIINDAAGNLVLDSAGNNNLTAKNISGQGPFATLAQITPSNVQTYIANLAINTLQLAGQAVTIPQGTYAGAQFTYSTSSAFSEIITNGTGFVSSGAPINIIINAVMSVKGSLQLDVQLQRLNSDGSLNAVLWEADQVLGQPGSPGLGVTAPAGFCYVDTPGAGTWYYRLVGRENGGAYNSNSWYTKNRYMLLLETKK